ncbi:MAG: ABC transporter permease [Fimbriimonas sp.]
MNLLWLTLTLAAPLVLAAMGGYMSERSGVVNIALEGKMLMAACVTAMTAWTFGPVASLGFGVLAAIALSLLHALATQHFRIDAIVSGMAVNALAAGGSNFVLQRFDDPSRSGQFPALPLQLFYVFAFAVPVLLWLQSKYFREGLHLIAVGADPEKARQAGLNPSKVRARALVFTGVYCGFAGALLATETGGFTDGMTAGRGYIALAALILGGWRPLPTLGACVAFGFFSALRLQLQGTPVFGVELPSELWASLPYVATLVALAGLLGRVRPPAGLGKP